MRENNTITKDQNVETKLLSDTNTLQDCCSSIATPDLSYLRKNQSTITPDVVARSTIESQPLTTLSSPFMILSSSEMKNASQLTIEHWKYIFETCNLGKALFIDGLKPKYSHESAIRLKDNTKPKTVVCDSSSIDARLTYTERSKLFVEYKFNDIEKSFSCPFVSFSDNYEKNEKMARNSSKKNLFTTCTWNFPRVSIKLDSHNIEATSEFLRDVDIILNSSTQDQYDRFKELFSDYGHVIATELIIGGQLHHADMRERTGSVDETQHKEERKQEFRAAVNLVTIPAKILIKAEASADAGAGKKTEAKFRDEDNRQIMNTTFQATGGDTLQCEGSSKWVSTIENFLNWRVISIEKTVPLYKLLDKDRQDKIESVLHQYQLKMVVPGNTPMPNDTQLSTHETQPRAVLPKSLIAGIDIVSKLSGTPSGYECITKVYDDNSYNACLTQYSWLGLRRLEELPESYTYIGDINGLKMCIRQGNSSPSTKNL
ncbi:unnamed protein product [Rotaria sordida]|uniref:MACPF-like domain-containing protein n=1 Tax=Rotaria sordida TaxID=392033 RepID=A0A815XH02_9BILA|nr:unnamed protein product [Rotaria sordida]CAF1557425.1 unnamed protein product [Rotaria sordida]